MNPHQKLFVVIGSFFLVCLGLGVLLLYAIKMGEKTAVFGVSPVASLTAVCFLIVGICIYFLSKGSNHHG